MDSRGKNIDDLFREGLSGYSELPPEAAWNGLQKQLHKKRSFWNRLSPNWLHYVLGSAIVVFLISSAVKFVANSSEKVTSSGIVTVNNGITNDVGSKRIGSGSSDKTSINNVITDNKTGDNRDAINNNATANQTKTGVLNSKLSVVDKDISSIQQSSEAEPAAENRRRGISGEKSKGVGLNSDGETISDLKKQDKFINGNRKQKYAGAQPPTRSGYKNRLFGKSTPTNRKCKVSQSNTSLASAAHQRNTGKKIVHSVPSNTRDDNSVNDTGESGRLSVTEKLRTQETNIVEQMLENNIQIVAGNGQVKKIADSTLAQLSKTHQDTFKIAATNTIKKSANIRPKFFDRIGFGVKGGMESDGTSIAHNYIFAPYVQFKMNNKFSIFLQPGVKLSQISPTYFSGALQFNKVNNDGTVVLNDSVFANVVTGPRQDSFWVRNYTYSQSHDSISKTYSFGGEYISFELPIMLQYKIMPHLSVLGGFNIVWNTVVNITEHTYTSPDIVNYGYASTIAPAWKPAPPPPPIGNYITYDAVPISEYKGPMYSAPQGVLLSVGWMAGVSLDLNNRFSMEAMVQQSKLPAIVVGGQDINSSLSALYWRVLIGYRIK
jgi:hypothetical protein